MKFTLSTADCTGNATNCLYPHDQEISTPEELAAAIMKDQVFARYKDSYRNIANFLESNVIPMDCDNDHSDKRRTGSPLKSWRRFLRISTM